MSSPSLLSFLDAPVVVGDPEGRAAYVNPAFEIRFSVAAEAVTGQPLASLFEGGVREAVLQAVADVCSGGRSARFRLRHAGIGYAGLASPIVADDERVGFVILLLESSAESERALALQRQVREPLGEIARVFDELGDADGARRSALIEDGLRAVGRLGKSADELGAVMSGRGAGSGRPRPGAFDPAPVVGSVAGRLSPRFAEAGVDLDVRVPATLPRVRGEAALLARALDGLLESRLSGCAAGSSLVLAARTADGADTPAVVVAVIDVTVADGSRPGEAEPDPVRRAVHALGGEIRTNQDAPAGRTTAIRLPALKL